MNCPVCNTTDLSDDTAMCPHCQSDLETFQLIVKANQQRQTHRILSLALGIFAAVTAIGWASTGIFSGETETGPVEISPEVTLQGEVRTPADSELITMLTTENASLKLENATLSSKLISAKAKPAVKVEKAVKAGKVSSSKTTAETESGTIIHTVKGGETLWIIARKHFRDGTKYKQIAKDNGISTKQKLKLGMKLKIQK